MTEELLSKKEFSKRILGYEILGFSLVALLLWLNELLDLPHHFFGTKATPINWSESVFESFFLLILAVFVLFISYRLMLRISSLEGVLHICPVCKRICAGENWTPLEDFLLNCSCAQFTHGICPECSRDIHHLEGVARKELARSLSSVSNTTNDHR